MLSPYLLRIHLFVFSIFIVPVSQFGQHVFQKVDPGVNVLNESNSFLTTAEYYQVDILQFVNKLNHQSQIEIEIPMGDRIKTLIFEKINILSPNYRLYSSSGKTMNSANKYAFYHGQVKGQLNSKATLIFLDNKFSITIFDEDGNFEINPIGDLYAGYFNHDLNEKWDQNWACQVIEEADKPIENNNGDPRFAVDPECVTIFLEIDNNMFIKKGSNIANTEAWVMNIMTQVAILFIEHNVPINISGIQVWDTADPYISATNTSQALNLFRNAVHNNPNFNGRLAHLLSGRSLGGGIAYLNTLCSTSTNVAVSANLNGGATPYPSYSWNVMVIAHETGHNMGSPHTQSCSWNGDNTAIDGCGNIEGSCPDPGNPPGGGTIMSYCHQISGVGINFTKGFGPQPGGLIEERYVNAFCETGTECSFVSPFNDVCNRAKELPVLNYCVKGYFENYATTPSGDGGNMSCGDSGLENDIWYHFDYIDVDTVHLAVEASDIISDLVVEIYTGDCNSLTSIDCGFSISGEQISFVFSDTNLINETLYIRIVEKGSDEEGAFSICIYSEEVPCQSQLDTLLNIYQDLDGPNWTNKMGWEEGNLNNACDYCNWYGITCNYLGQIETMDLSDNNLQGMLPQDLVALTYLKYLRFNDNLLIDTIPDYWDTLANLYILDLRFNSFTGSIPLSFTTMAKINSIHLDNNSLDSLIPPGLGYNSSLRTFTASNNFLEGCFVAGINSFCSKDSINLSNNPDLPFAGDVTLLCEEGWGTDWDLDGFCNEVEDCDDYDVDINPGADEILCDAKDNNCDGSIDEGSDYGPNVWIGPDTLGIFDDTLNWSLNHIPKICENVEIGTNGDVIDLVILGNDEGGGQGGGSEGFGTLQIRNLTIGTNSTVYLGDTISLSIIGNGVLVNDGTFIATGYINIRDQNNTTNTAFVNNGTFTVMDYGGISINEIGDYGIHNTSTGILELDGYSNIESYDSEVAKSGLINDGILKVLQSLSFYGTFTQEAIINGSGGVIEVKDGAFLSIY